MTKLITSFILIISCIITNAEINSVIPKDTSNVKIVNILFSGEINQHKIAELIGTLNAIKLHMGNVEKIYLYINSGGGNMDAGYIGYLAIKSFPIPIATVNYSFIASAASLLYCGAKERLAFNQSTFLLHASSINLEGNFKPDTLERLKKDNDHYNGIFKYVYQKCTNLSNKKLNSILYSESNSLSITAKEGNNLKLVTDIIDNQPNNDAIYFVIDNAN